MCLISLACRLSRDFGSGHLEMRVEMGASTRDCG